MPDQLPLSSDRGSISSISGENMLHNWLNDEQFHNVLDVFGDSTAASPGVNKNDVGENQQLFPMLGDSSFEYEDDSQLLLHGNDAFPFDHDISPILAPIPMPTELDMSVKTPTGVTPHGQPVLKNTPRSALKSGTPTYRNKTPPTIFTLEDDSATTTTVSSSLSSIRTPAQTDRTSNITNTEIKQRPRSAKKSTPSPPSAVQLPSWSEQEQNLFFSIFKSKWPPRENNDPVAFGTLLLRRFDVISQKIKTKTVLDVRAFYTHVLANISNLLQELENDIDLTNPDEIRIAVWCWSKLLTDEGHKKEFQSIESASPQVKKRLSHVLLQSIIRSRRQMLKAKSSIYSYYVPSAASSQPSSVNSKQKANKEMSSIAAPPKVQENAFSAARSTSPSAIESNAVVIHHPLVRKKISPRLQQRVAPAVSSASFNQPPLKRKRDDSVEGVTVHATTSSPTKTKKISTPEPASFFSPPPSVYSNRKIGEGSHQVAFQTPQSSSQKKKMYIKMRIVPSDKDTKAKVVQCGYNPKVELKLTSTKKISEVALHMAKKWSKVRALVPATAVLRFFQRDREARGSGWSHEDNTITCYDIWKKNGKQTNDSNVVVISYEWVSTPEDEINTTLLSAPAELFENKVAHAINESNVARDSANSSTAILPSPTYGLQEFGKSVAFPGAEFTVGGCDSPKASMLASLMDESDGEDADSIGVDSSPNTSVKRRRITPTLVAKEEIKI